MSEEMQKQEEIVENKESKQTPVVQESVSQEPSAVAEPVVLSDSEKIDLILKEMKALKTEVFINRIIFAIALIVAMVYAHFQAAHFGEILGTLLEMFLSA